MAKKKVEGWARIKVIDKVGGCHEFEGTIRMWHEGQVCRIWDVVSNVTLASFDQPAAVTVRMGEIK